MPLPGTNAITTLLVEADDPLTGLYPFTSAPAITAPADNSVGKIAWDSNPYNLDITFTWSALAGAAAYELEIGDINFSLLHTIFVSGIPALTYSIKAYKFPLDTSLYVRVHGTDTDGYRVSPWSEVIEFSLVRERLQEGVEQMRVKINATDYEEQYFMSVQPSSTEKKRATTPGPMKLHLDDDGSPPDWLKDGMMWYDETEE